MKALKGQGVRGECGKDERGGSRRERESVLHSFAAAGPVAVVKIEAFTLEDEGPNAVLERRSECMAHSVIIALCHLPAAWPLSVARRVASFT